MEAIAVVVSGIELLSAASEAPATPPELFSKGSGIPPVGELRGDCHYSYMHRSISTDARLKLAVSKPHYSWASGSTIFPKSISDIKSCSGFAAMSVPIQKLTPVQEHVIISSDSSLDRLVQSRAGTGKTTSIGVLLSLSSRSQRFRALVCFPDSVLLNEGKKLISNTLRFSFWSVCGIDENGEVQVLFEPLEGSGNIVYLGTVEQLRSLSETEMANEMNLVVFDEADILFDDAQSADSLEILRRFVGPRTTTMFYSATFPPYIVTRIEKSLLSVDPGRMDPPTHIKLCSSTSTSQEDNAVVSHLEFHYQTTSSADDSIARVCETIKHRLRLRDRCIVFGGDNRTLSTLRKRLVSSGYRVVLVSSGSGDVEKAQVILDPRGYFSRGVNIPSLTLGIAVNIPEDKETMIHQWGRIAREGQLHGEFHMIIPNEEIEQLQFLSFQLGVVFQKWELHSPSCEHLHPFETDFDTDTRLGKIQALVDRFITSKS
jgi:superfamily II DNA/RNA helicase